MYEKHILADKTNLQNTQSFELNMNRKDSNILRLPSLEGLFRASYLATRSDDDEEVGTPNLLLESPVYLNKSVGDSKKYQRFEKLGEGTYATVYRAVCLYSGERCAIKEIKLEPTEGVPCTALREASILSKLKHKNIVSLIDILSTNSSLSFVFEYVSMDLKKYMEVHKGLLTVHNAKRILKELLEGCGYFHAKNILHRDLKPQNILIGSNGAVKIADFGLARTKGVSADTFSNEVVTLWYRAPEALLGIKDYCTSLDIWSLGCIFYEMVAGKPLFSGTDKDKQLLVISKILGLPCHIENTHDYKISCKWTSQEVRAMSRRIYFRKQFIDQLRPILISTQNDNNNNKYVENSVIFTNRSLKETEKIKLARLEAINPRLKAKEVKLLELMLDYDFDARITAAAALAHPALS